MNAERLKQIEEVYHAALEILPSERESFFAKSCGADAELRREVESLLAFENPSDNDFLDAPPASLAAEMITERENETSLAGKQIGRYKVRRLLGVGGMGEVYLAEDARLNRKVALKILPETFAADARRLGRFEQEARAVSALNHPNILTVHEFSADAGVHFLATEYVEGETLRSKIHNGELSLTDALKICEQAAFALSAAHAAGIVHRDIKPENIMIRADGIVKVLDFGIAKLIAPPLAAEAIDTEGETLHKKFTQTAPGAIIGTLAYMSPEQVRGKTLDARSDIFSLGVVLYEMLSGKDPFERATSGDTIAAILTENPPPVTDEMNGGAPTELERILSKSLQKNADERYQTSRDFLLDVKSLRREIEFTTTNPRLSVDYAPRTDEQKIHETRARAARRFSFAAALSIFLAATLAIGAALWFFTKNDSQGAASSSSAPLPVAEVATWRSTPGEIYTVGAFSNDGKMLAFSSTKSGTKSIWVKQLSGGEAVQITKDEFANQYPVWSPNGDEIAYHSTRGGAGGIWRMPALGGSPTLLKTVADGGMILRRWSKTNVIYYEADGNFFALDAKTNQANQLTNFDDKKRSASSFAVSPDEKQIAYITFENERNIIWTMPASGGEPKQIIESADEIRNAIWHSDNKRILYSQSVGGVFQIFAADASSGGKPSQITFGDADALALDVSSDGAKVLYGASKEESDVWGVSVEKSEEFSVAADINSELWAAPAPDGKSVAYQSIKNLSQGNKLFGGAILTKAISAEEEDAAPAQITASGGLPVWSPDGKRLAFLRQSGDEYNLWTTGASGGEERQLTTGNLTTVEYTTLPYNRRQASYYSWSPDNQKIAYVLERDELKNIWLADANGAGNTQLTNNSDSNLSVYCPLWSADGGRVAYALKAQKSLADEKTFYVASVIDAQTKESKIVAQTENFQRLLGWSASNEELILAAVNSKNGTGSPTEVSIVQANVETGERRQIAKLDAAYLYNVCLSADKKLLAYVSNKDGKDNIWLLRLAGGDARRLTANNDARLYFSAMSFAPDNRAIYFGKQARYSLLSMVSNFK